MLDLKSKILVGLMLVFAAGGGEAFALRVAESPEGHDEHAVRVGFVELWADASRFDGHVVQVSGYVVRGLGQTLLYPDKDYFEFQSRRGGLSVYLKGDADIVFDRMRERRESGDWRYELACPALISGTYKRVGVGDFGSLGELMSDPTKVVITDSCNGIDDF